MIVDLRRLTFTEGAWLLVRYERAHRFLVSCLVRGMDESLVRWCISIDLATSCTSDEDTTS